MYITQRLACVLHHLYTALAKVLLCGVNTTGKPETEQCVRYKEVDLRLVQHLQKTCTDMSVSCLLSEKVRVMVLRATGNSHIKDMFYCRTK